MKISSRFSSGIVLPILLSTFALAAYAFQPPIEQAAAKSNCPACVPLQAIAVAGKRLVAVGARGHIVVSDDDGKHWRQAEVPVSSDLVAVSFPTPDDGWAVGHGGVILHSADGGLSWTKQMVGRNAYDVALRFYQAAAQQPHGKDVDQALQQEEAASKDEGTPSFMDVHFQNAKVGFVVGTFNHIFRTDDGGKTWVPWMDKTDNPNSLNFYGVRERQGRWYIVGEQGMAWTLGATKDRFDPVPAPYKGTLFGLMIDSGNQVFTYGMRGSLFRSSDQGKNWVRVDAGAPAGITGAAELRDGRIVIVNQAGGYGVSADRGQTFKPKNASIQIPNFGVTATQASAIVLVGALGTRVERLD